MLVVGSDLRMEPPRDSRVERWRERVGGHHSKLWIRSHTRGNNWSSPDFSVTLANKVSVLLKALGVENLK